MQSRLPLIRETCQEPCKNSMFSAKTLGGKAQPFGSYPKGFSVSNKTPELPRFIQQLAAGALDLRRYRSSCGARKKGATILHAVVDRFLVHIQTDVVLLLALIFMFLCGSKNHVYSLRKAAIGSTCAALLAGIQHANAPVPTNNRVVPAKVAGS